MVTPEQREHWRLERSLLQSILGLLLGTIVGGGVWIGTIQTTVAGHTDELTRQRDEIRASLQAQWAEIAAVADRQRALETSNARIDERLRAIETSSARIERQLERILESISRSTSAKSESQTR